ncbi:MAG TPA: DUF2235 domain-containing protein [Acidobacteriaceae bacterium]|nr:DUF2235 domain-containing protein [Acidobacteriaceae bacterium]
MSKRIIFCCDGTWQNPADNTNVYRLYNALTTSSDQMPFYDTGVGADATGLQRIITGATGSDLFTKITNAYTKIAHVYEPGDQIYLFGFSRGAYTARSLAGFIAACGVPTGAFTDNAVTQLFSAYRNPPTRAAAIAQVASSSDAPQGLSQPGIKFIGVWDTVGSLGIPALFGGIDTKQYGFLNLDLHPNVENALHLLAIDEHRPQFPLTLWNQPNPPVPGQNLEQVWFSGCHGDCGGGLQQGGPVDGGTRLCDITLAYMINRAQSLGLTFSPASKALFATLPAQYALDAINESYKPVDGPIHLRPIPAGSRISNSVALRIQYALTYQPGNLTLDHDLDANTYALSATYTQVNCVNPEAL